ncbi:MAG: AMP-binding protein [Gemmataceae bacterium]
MGTIGADPLLAFWTRSVQAYPDLPAVRFRGESFSYTDLDSHSRRWAAAMRHLGVTGGDRVALCLERGLSVPVALLAVLTPAPAYVRSIRNTRPIRLAFMLEDSARIVLTQQSLRDLIRYPADRTYLVDNALPETVDANLTAVDYGPAYVIYTSGSTGRPKGVVMRRASLANLIAWQVGDSALGPGERTLQYTPAERRPFPGILRHLGDRRNAGAGRRGDAPRPGAPCFATSTPSGSSGCSCHSSRLQAWPRRPRHHQPGPGRGSTSKSSPPVSSCITPAIEAFFTRLPGCSLANHYGPSETHVVTAHAAARRGTARRMAAASVHR